MQLCVVIADHRSESWG